MENTLTLQKGNDIFIFKYEVGSEADVLDAIIDMVKRPDLYFDWFDAAIISNQLGQQIAVECQKRLRSSGESLKTKTGPKKINE